MNALDRVSLDRAAFEGAVLGRRRFLGLWFGALAAAAWRRGVFAPRVASAAGAAAGAAAAATGTSAPAPGTSAAATAKKSAAATPSRRAAMDLARQQILRYCARLEFPNGAIHAVRALGRDTPLGPGDPFRLLLENYVIESYVAGHDVLEVPPEREGHRNAMLKTLLERGCPADLTFTLQGRTRRFQELIDSARLLVSYPGSMPIDEHSWTIIALAPLTPASSPTWLNARGETVDLGRMIDDTSAAYRDDTARIWQIDPNQADPPRDCPILGRVCGGMHMLYAVAVALAHGWDTPARRRLFAHHMQTQIRRLAYDENVTQSVERQNAQAAGRKAAWAVSYDSRVKALGHLFEVIAVVDQAHLYTFSPADRTALAAGRERLCQAILSARDVDLNLLQPQKALYESVTTNLCHAYNGLRLSPG